MSEAVSQSADFIGEASERQYAMLEDYLGFVTERKIRYLDLSGNSLTVLETKGFLATMLLSLD